MYPKTATPSNRFANASRIRTIDFALSGIGGTGTLSPRARRTLAVYVALIKMGYDGISAPMGSIADAIYRSSHGEAGSIRTLQRAHRELEERGFIRCAVFRPGEYSKGAMIWFHHEAFSYWTRKTTQRVSPLPTQSYSVEQWDELYNFSAHTTTCRPSDRTRDQVASNSQDLSKNEHTKQRAGARASKKPRKRKSQVLFSVDKTISKMKGVTRADRRAARARAEVEMKARIAGVELINPSGIDWSYWEKRWNEFSIAVRETTTAREIIPRLLSTGDSLPEPISGIHENVEQLDETLPPTTEDIRKLRAKLEERFSLPDIKNMAVAPDHQNYPEVDENDPDMAKLIAARDKARARALVNGW